MLKALLFDWGDTVMTMLPDARGPMAHWPRVQAVEGARGAMESVRHRYRLFLAANAGESGAPLVREALARVQMGSCFEDVFTAKELGPRKPDPAFFRAILDRVGCQPTAAVMIGDDLRVDIEGARRAGLWAIWFNPQGLLPPTTLLHAPHAEIRSFGELEGALHSLEPRARSLPPGH